MGFSGKTQVVDSVIAGIPLRAPLKPLYTKKERENSRQDDEEEYPTTPKGEEARIPARLVCPPPPRKRKTSLKCNYNGVREYFMPPDLETVFIRHVERANS